MKGMAEALEHSQFIQNIQDFLNTPVSIQQIESALSAPHSISEIEWKDVCFSYAGKTNVLNKVSFKVKAEEKIGFSGFSNIFSFSCRKYSDSQT